MKLIQKGVLIMTNYEKDMCVSAVNHIKITVLNGLTDVKEGLEFIESELTDKIAYGAPFEEKKELIDAANALLKVADVYMAVNDALDKKIEEIDPGMMDSARMLAKIWGL